MTDPIANLYNYNDFVVYINQKSDFVIEPKLLRRAIKIENMDAISLILDKAPDLTKNCFCDILPKNNYDLIDLFFAHGFNINSFIHSNNVIWYSNTDMLRYLLNLPYQIITKETLQKLLSQAIIHNHVEKIKILFEYDAIMELEVFFDCAPIDTIKILFDEHYIDIKIFDADFLLASLERDDIELTKFILDVNSDLTIITTRVFTNVVKYHMHDIIELFLDRGYVPPQTVINDVFKQYHKLENIFGRYSINISSVQ